MHLRWNYNRGRDREPRLFVSHYDCWRRDLLHIELRQTALGRRKAIMVAAPAPAADHFLRRWQRIGIGRRSDQSHGFVWRNPLYDLMTEQSSAEEQTDQCDMQQGGHGYAVRPVVVVA